MISWFRVLLDLLMGLSLQATQNIYAIVIRQHDISTMRRKKYRQNWEFYQAMSDGDFSHQ